MRTGLQNPSGPAQSSPNFKNRQHLQVLDYLSRRNRYNDTPAALANYPGMTRGTVSQTLLLPVKKSFIQKTTDTADRRRD